MGDIRSLSEYLRRLNTLLVCPRAYRKRFLSEAQRMADDYRQGNLGASDEEVIEFLGEPQELAAVFLENIDPDELRRYKTRRTWMRRGLAFSIAVVICLLTTWCIYLKTRLIEPEVTVTETLYIYPEEEV